MKNPLLALKIVAVVLAVVIIVLLGVLFFYSPAKAPASPRADMPPTETSTIRGAASFSGGMLAVGTSSLRVGALVESPLKLEGEAATAWLFNGTFPIEMRDAYGIVIGTTTAHGEGSTAATGTVPWTATLDFTAPQTATGTVIFMAGQNPTAYEDVNQPNGLPRGNATSVGMLIVPVRFR